MSFLYPWALLGLIAIPILIIIYILRNKYKESTAPSTYLWEMAAKFLKKRNPLSRFEHLLALIVQICAIALLSITLAHPTFTIQEGADNIVFVLDASASMGMTHEGETRFDKAKRLIAEKAAEANQGSTFTLIAAETEARKVCQKVDDLSRFQMYLDSLTLGDAETHLADSLAIAQQLFSEDEANLCYLATDQKCPEELEGITLLDVSDDEQNYAISSLNYTLSTDKKNITFTGDLLSYASDATLNVSFYVNDEELTKADFQCVKGDNFPFVTNKLAWTGKAVNSVKAVINNEDGLMLDNSYIRYNNDTTQVVKALVVSSAPTYLTKIFDALKTVQYRVIAPSHYTTTLTGYDLYVFDSFSPATMPEDGAVMMFGAPNTVFGSGFTAGGKVSVTAGATLGYAENESLLYQRLTRQLSRTRDIIVSKYQKYSLTENFTTILTLDNVPLLFAGRNASGQRQVIWAFDLHDSNLPLLYDYVVYMRNFVEYAKPRTMTAFDYEVGEEAIFSIPDEVKSLSITTPDGKTEPVLYAGDEEFAYPIEQVGAHLLTSTYEDGTTKTLNFYARINATEEDPQPVAEAAYGLAVKEDLVRGDGIWDKILPFIIAAALFFAGDWIMYTHEQY